MPRVYSFPATFTVWLDAFGNFMPVVIEQWPVFVVVVGMLLLLSNIVRGADTIFRIWFATSSKHFVHCKSCVSMVDMQRLRVKDANR